MTRSEIITATLYIYFHRIFFISSLLFNFVFVLYVFTAAFCQQFIKEYDDDDDDDNQDNTIEKMIKIHLQHDQS